MKTLARSILYLGVMLLLISAISFFAVKLAPNSFLSAGELNPNITEASIKTLKQIYGLDKPLYIQYIQWIKNTLHLEFGISFSSGKSVREEIMSRLPITLAINISSLVIIFFIGLFGGIIAALREGTKTDKAIVATSLIGFSMPSFYLALLCIMFFSLYLGIFPISGISQTDKQLNGIQKYSDIAHHLFLPVMVIVITSCGSLILYLKSLTLEILKSDYVFFALSRGVSKTRLICSYILPNLSGPLVTMIGLSLPGIIGGSVILESIFAINGMGLLFYQSVISRDYPVILGITMIGAFLTLLGNLFADIVLARLNPFIRQN